MGISRPILERPLVTGAGGFIGYHICKLLNDLDEVREIIALDLPGAKNNLLLKDLRKVKLIESSINLESLQDPEIGKPSSAFALAAINGTSRFYSEPFYVLENSTLPTLALLKTLDLSCPIVYSSSSEVYASNDALGLGQFPSAENVPISIDNILNPRWSYAVAKIHGEMALVASAIEHGRPVSIVRYHNVYGPSMGLDHFIPDFIARAKLGEYRIQNGEATRSFLHVSDAAMGTVLALKQASRQTQLFHLGSMEEMSIRTAANRILTVMGLTGKTMSESQGPMGSVMRRVPDNSKAKKLLGWSPKVSFEEGILDFLNSL